jgi:hypothetical protein
VRLGVMAMAFGLLRINVGHSEKIHLAGEAIFVIYIL